MNFLTKREIKLINKEMTLKFGGLFFSGNDNVKNESSLDYLVDAVKETVFGHELYKTDFEKAAAYMFLIIKDHIFHDGNKRTAVESAFVFLEKNDYSINDDLESSEIVNVAENVATDRLKLADIASWLRNNCSRKNR